MNKTMNQRRFKIILVYLLLLSPWIGIGAIAALQPVANSPLDWVDANFAPRADYDAFSERFGSADVVFISWPGCTIENSSLDLFCKSLRKSSCFFDAEHWLFHRVVSGRELHQAFSGPVLGLSDQQARQRLAGSLLGPDNSTTAVVIAFNDEGLRQRTRLVPLIRAAASKYAGAEYTQQHLAGPIMDGYAVDRASEVTMSRFAPMSSIIVLCVCIVCLESIYAAVLVFAMSCVSQVIALAILHHGGGEMTALMIVLPPLIQVLAIAGGIHIVNYTIDAARETGHQSAVAKAIQIGWLPCVLSSATTAIGLGSLAVSGLAAVREFGIFAAMGVLTTVGVLLVLLPGFLNVAERSVVGSPKNPRPQKIAALWTALMKLQSKYATLVCIFTAIGITVLGIGVSRLQASVRIETLFGKDSRLWADYAWLETHVGPLVPIEAVVTIPESSRIEVGQQFVLLHRLEQRLRESPHVAAVTSCLDYLPQPPATLEGEAAERALATGEAAISRAGYLSCEGATKHWRLTAHVSALANIHYGDTLQSIQDSMTDPSDPDDLHRYTVKLSGLMPLVHEIQSQLLQDLFASFLTAFVLIGVVMTIVEAGFLAGVLSMIPNVFPALALFGFLGWIEHPVDIGSIMTASVAMGIAVDDTLHFLTFFTRRVNQGATRIEAVHAAYRHCGRAMIQTTLICGAGLAIFAMSDFVPTARFAWMMVALLTCAIIGDLLILPAILLSPLGIVFEPRQSMSEIVCFDDQVSGKACTIDQSGSTHCPRTPSQPMYRNFSVSLIAPMNSPQ
ncbi:efflux RND transporter permease subunit [Planctomycetaceae bacterium SH139]